MPSLSASRKNGKIGGLSGKAGKDSGILGKDHGKKGGRPRKVKIN